MKLFSVGIRNVRGQKINAIIFETRGCVGFLKEVYKLNLVFSVCFQSIENCYAEVSNLKVRILRTLLLRQFSFVDPGGGWGFPAIFSL